MSAPSERKNVIGTENGFQNGFHHYSAISLFFINAIVPRNHAHKKVK